MANRLITVQEFYRELFDTLSKYLDPEDVERLADEFNRLQSVQAGDVPAHREFANERHGRSPTQPSS